MPTISLRVSESQKMELEDRSNGNVSDYMKSVLFAKSDPSHMLETILERLETKPAEAVASAGIDRQTLSILVELLQLMRFTVKPETKEKAQAEVERLGFSVVQSEDFRR